MRNKLTYLLLVTGLCLALGVGLTVKGKSETMSEGFPDWTQAVALIGKDPDGNLILIGVDADGYLTIPIKGEDPDGDLVTIAVDLDGQLYTIIKGSDGNIVAVDSDGFITTILKGDYEGALTTVGLDADGRLTCYVVDDQSQWGGIIRTGNAELAARLGSPVAWDWRGQVQAIHTFERGLANFSTATSGTGASITVDPTTWISGGYSAKMVAGSDVGQYATLTAGVGLNPNLQAGATIRFATDNPPEYLYLAVQIFDGTNYDFFQLLYAFDTNALTAYISPNSWTSVGTVDVQNDLLTFNSLKLVADGTEGKYMRALFNGNEFAIPTLVPPSVASGVGPSMRVRIHIQGHAGDNDVLYIDSVVFTSNEPT